MSRDHTKQVIVALDIGTSKVVAMVAECLPDGKFEVLGQGQAHSIGIRKGVVVNIDDTVKSIQKALEEAQLMADCKIHSVYTGIGGNHIVSFNSSGMVAVVDKEVTKADINRVIETAKAVNIPAESQIVHVITQQFTLDKQEGILHPVGMAGIRLEVRVHIVTGSHSASQNIVKCIRRCGLEVNDLILQPLAASLACLAQDEKDLGVILADIGAGTTGIAIFREGSVRHTSVMAFGGEQITNDLAFGLRIPTDVAEQIKLEYGIAKQSLVHADEVFEIQSLGERESRIMSREVLAQIVQPRVEEILQNVLNTVRESGVGENINNIVLTGGTALLPGIVEVAESIFGGGNVRVGAPIYNGHLSDIVCHPQFSTVMGLLTEAQLQKYGYVNVSEKKTWMARFLEFFKKSF